MPRGGDLVTDLLLGIDVGTSACKAAVVDLDGAELAHGQVATPWTTVPTGAEADPDALFDAAIDAARQAIERAPGGRVAAIGVTSMAEAGVLRDDAGNVLHPAVAWYDARGEGEARLLARELPEFVERTGLPPTPLCTLAKLRHLGTTNAARWLNVAEWVVHRLGGRQVAELSLASRTGLLDLDAQAPYADAFDWAALPADLIPDIVTGSTDAGRSDGAALPATAGATLAVAGHDHLVAGVGVGVVAPGDLLDSCGTAEALVRVVEPLDEDARRRAVSAGTTIGWHVTPGRQALLAGLWSGMALREVLDALGVDETGRDELDAGALAIAPGDAPALEVSLHDLERSAPSLPQASPAAIWRAAIDRVADEVEASIARIDDVAGPHTKLVVTGGWTRDRAVLEAKRRLGAIETPAVVEAGCRGAALLAGVAAGIYPSADELPAVRDIAKEHV
jgi:sugar (pentulose or hexulose) kinase